MGKISTKQNKSAYQLEREKLHLTRAEAADKMSSYGMTEHRLVRIEDGTSNVEPEDVYAMSKAYNAPQLCNHYCSNECRIGREYVPEIKVKELSGIVLEMLASLTSKELAFSVSFLAVSIISLLWLSTSKISIMQLRSISLS